MIGSGPLPERFSGVPRWNETPSVAVVSQINREPLPRNSSGELGPIVSNRAPITADQGPPARPHQQPSDPQRWLRSDDHRPQADGRSELSPHRFRGTQPNQPPDSPRQFGDHAGSASTTDRG